MPKLTRELVEEGYHNREEGPAIKIQHKQISSIDVLDSLLPHPNKIAYLDLSFNTIRTVAGCLEYMVGLKYLDLSTNLLTEISGLESLSQLTLLRLSRNRITKIANLEGNLHLNVLDLSMNQLTRIENINHLKEIQFLYLYGNKIKHLEGIENLRALKELRIEQNSIVDINILSAMKAPLVELQAHSNNITSLDDVIIALSHLKKLAVLSLYENPIASDPTYRFRVLKQEHIKNLDGLLVKKYIRGVLNDIATDDNLDQIVIKSQSKINELIERERQVKDSAVSLMKQQISQIEKDFIEFSQSMELELEQVNEYAAIIRTKKHLGEDIANDTKKLHQWREKIDQQTIDRHERIRQRELKLEQERQEFFRGKRYAIDFSGKLFEIAQVNPKKWRDIKEDMWKKRLEMETHQVDPVPTLWDLKGQGPRSEFQEIDPELQIELANKAMSQVLEDMGGQMGSEAAVRIEAAENQATEKLLGLMKAKQENAQKNSKACSVF